MTALDTSGLREQPLLGSQRDSGPSDRPAHTHPAMRAGYRGDPHPRPNRPDALFEPYAPPPASGRHAAAGRGAPRADAVGEARQPGAQASPSDSYVGPTLASTKFTRDGSTWDV